MLTFEEKLKIIESFPELERKDVSLGRVNFHYNNSASDKKNVVYHLHPNGNGFIYAGELTGYETDEKGMVNIRNFTEKALRNALQNAILSLTADEEEEEEEEDVDNESWINNNTQVLTLIKEGDLWNVFADDKLDGTFTTYKEATQFLDEEGFSKI